MNPSRFPGFSANFGKLSPALWVEAGARVRFAAAMRCEMAPVPLSVDSLGEPEGWRARAERVAERVRRHAGADDLTEEEAALIDATILSAHILQPEVTRACERAFAVHGDAMTPADFLRVALSVRSRFYAP